MRKRKASKAINGLFIVPQIDFHIQGKTYRSSTMIAST